MKQPSQLKDLVAWQLAVELRRVVHGYCERPAIKRDFKFHGNLADAASSAPRNLAEGFGRKYHKEFARFAIIARGSEREVLECLTEALEREYINRKEFDSASQLGERAIRVLNGLIAYLESTPDWGRR